MTLRKIEVDLLLLVDDPGEGARFQRSFAATQACAMVPLDEALQHRPQHNAIACLATLDADTSAQLREALGHHRSDPRIPVLFLMRDTSLYATTQATALGATDFLPCDASHDDLAAAARRMAESGAPVAAPKPEARLEAEVGAVGASLVAMLEAARARTTFPSALLERGADELIASIRRAGIRQWLDFVRRHDDLTYQHCLLVAGLVAAFAARLGIAPAGQRMLAQAALVHDIGKAAIPRHILNKAGGLTAEEQALVRTHPAEGHAILSRQRGLDPRVLMVVRHHHEYLDGSGYPDRLRGSQIPDFVRLTTICDITAALVERRAYKPPMPPRQAHATLVEMGGKLDQGLVAAFAKLVADV